MSYRIVGLITVRDPAAFDDYRSRVGATIAQYGGTVRQRGAVDAVLWNETGGVAPDAFVDIEFPSKADAQRWADSPEYQALLEVRSRAMQLLLFAVA